MMFRAHQNVSDDVIFHSRQIGLHIMDTNGVPVLFYCLPSFRSISSTGSFLPCAHEYSNATTRPSVSGYPPYIVFLTQVS